MSKMNEMEATIRELRDIASSINDIANWLTGAFSGTGKGTHPRRGQSDSGRKVP